MLRLEPYWFPKYSKAFLAKIISISSLEASKDDCYFLYWGLGIFPLTTDLVLCWSPITILEWANYLPFIPATFHFLLSMPCPDLYLYDLQISLTIFPWQLAEDTDNTLKGRVRDNVSKMVE